MASDIGLAVEQIPDATTQQQHQHARQQQALHDGRIAAEQVGAHVLGLQPLGDIQKIRVSTCSWAYALVVAMPPMLSARCAMKESWAAAYAPCAGPDILNTKKCTDDEQQAHIRNHQQRKHRKAHGQKDRAADQHHDRRHDPDEYLIFETSRSSGVRG